ncbi:DNA-binding transcriptional regulator, LysR family [Variovorax sp. HW608]|uniref:LysR family transcriptional regulator n=1 Tax=Variovorax sp. HW608 TaxID=1034889 RepID=UPI00081FF356|nr:LysR family transcriptional regulator [Variovorax sp. HW608]SCK21552.1 DNA-binding transcriptional regulator, LysR family [Variovorax sp. HW608]
MNTRQLRHFLAVMDLGSLAAAAEAVHLSPPALSRSLRALEDELRVPLFDRQDRRLRPTPYAITYAERARRIVFDEREGARSLALMRSGELGSLSFGMGSSIAMTLLGPMVLELLSAAPGLRLTTLVQSTDVLLAALQREELDFFVGDVRAADADSSVSAEPVYDCSFGWFARRDHPLAGQPRIGIDELRRFPLIMSGYANEALLRRMALLYGLALPVQQHFAASTNDVSTVLTLLTSSDAIAPSTDVAVISALRAGTLVRLDVQPALDLELTLGIVEHTGRTRLPAAERAFEVVRTHFAAVREEVAAQRSREPVRGRARARRAAH